MEQVLKVKKRVRPKESISATNSDWGAAFDDPEPIPEERDLQMTKFKFPQYKKQNKDKWTLYLVAIPLITVKCDY